MSTHPTSKARRKRQKLKRKYARLREDCQLADIIETTPEGAVRDERVPPSAQGSQPMSELVAQAIRRGWAVDEGMKPHLVDEMVQIVMNADMPAKAKIAAFNALRMGDQAQWDREHPKDQKDAGPTAININVVTVDGAPGKDDAGEQAVQLPDGTPRPRLTTINVEKAVGGFGGFF